MSTADTSKGNGDTAGPGQESLAEMSLIAHLTELRYRMFISVGSIMVAAIICWFLSEQIYNILVQPVTRVLEAYPDEIPDARLAILSLTEAFVVYLKIAATAGLFLASPILLAQMWLFIDPGLYRQERLYALPVILFSAIFFLAGGAFGYLVLFPVMAGFFINLGVSGNMLPLLSANALFGFLLRTLLGCAIVFEWPVVVFFLARMGILTARTMLRGFRYAVLAIFVIAAVVTPTPDMATQTILAAPMLGLYALGILIAWVVQPRKK
jgi:sec-independent protein translocase protein TatC